MNEIRALIVDDEPLARERIRERLSKVEGVVVQEAGRGADAIEALQKGQADIVFLDIHLPDMTGLDVVSRVGADAMPVTIFVTAYDEHAVAAFDLAAVDYLVKPFDDERFDKALGRALKAIHARHSGEVDKGLTSLVGAPRWSERLAVPGRGKIQMVPVEMIDYITSSGPYAELHTKTGRHLLRMPLQELEHKLDPTRFLRVHRTAIVQLDRVTALLSGGGGDYEVQLTVGVRLPVSRMRKEELERRLAEG